MSHPGVATRRAATVPWALWAAMAVLLGGVSACSGADRTPPGSPARVVTAGRSATAGATTTPADAGNGLAEPAGSSDVSGGGHLVAEAREAELAVRDQPSTERRPELTLSHPTPSGAPLVLLVTERRDDWLRVLLPVRPNGSQGWVPADQVVLSGSAWRIEVRLTAHVLTVHNGDEVWMVEPIAVGNRPTPTPGGTFYLIELLQPPEPDGPYGPYAFGLSGFSEVLTSFGDGDGRLGLHGTDDPTSLGGDVTNGCIRLANEAITQLARTVPLGTPVTIHP